MALRDELRAGHPAGRLYAETIGSALIAHVREKYGSTPRTVRTHRGGLAPHRLRLVQEYVDASVGLDFGVPDLAGLLQMNVDSFIRAFRQSMGVPPHRYVLMQRVTRAKALLRDRRLTIAEVALRAGFGSQSSFTRAFRRLAGLTPRHYRRSL
jgi:AraC family transcriptional regulator